LKLPLLGDVPIDTRVRSGGDEGKPVVVAAPDSPAAVAFSAIASLVAAKISMQAMRTLRIIEAD